METINIHEAKTHLSRLIEKAVAGEPFIIAKAGKPMVQVTAVVETTSAPRRKLGFLKGQFKVPKNFKAFAHDEVDEMFYGNPGKFASKKAKK
jgi:prevent-host-death family protein